ncbi:MAG: hypothetical protein HUU01_11155 [Saprospiraceae bacterium]|nr:hypothetical protein [Saprospiraceae bacterium]
MTSNHMDAAGFVLDLYNEHQDARLVFHNYALNVELTEKADALCQQAQTEAETRDVVRLSAQFLLTGYLFDYRNPMAHSLRTAARFLESHPLQNRVSQCIQSIFEKQQPETTEAKYLSDAWQVCLYIENGAEKSTLLRLERFLMMNEEFPERDWHTLQMQELLQVKLYTHAAKIRYEQALGARFLQQKSRMEKGSRTGLDSAPRPFQGISKRVPGGAVQTFFRTNYRTHINLSAIADNKANIMISVNTILISVLISALSYRNISETNPVVMLPAVIFLVSGLASLIFAVLSARPKVTRLLEKNHSPEVAQKNIVFFGNFVTLSPDRYEAALDAALRDGELLYGNMARDLYNLGKVLDQKYRYLTTAYNIFMIGFISAVGVFLVTLFL